MKRTRSVNKRTGIPMPKWNNSWRTLAENALSRTMFAAEVESVRAAYARQAAKTAFLSPDQAVSIACAVKSAAGNPLSVDVDCLAVSNYGWDETDTEYEAVVSFNTADFMPEIPDFMPDDSDGRPWGGNVRDLVNLKDISKEEAL